MPPKKVAAAAAPTSTQVFVVWSANGPKSVHATRESADQALAASTPNSFIDAVDFIAGSAATTNVKDEKKPAAKAKAAPKSKLVKVEEKEEIDDGGDTQDEEEAPKPVAKKTKTPAQQRAANAEKPGKPGDADLPANVRRLLADGGTVFEGKTVIVTGVPPTLGRKNTERLVEAFGAHLGKSLSRKTDYVVVGNDAGPKKLLQIEDLGLKTLDEDDLVALLEKGGSNGIKRSASEEDDEEEELEEKKPKATKAKRQKK